MLAEKFNILIKNIFPHTGKKRIKLQFKNGSKEDILLLRVLIGDKIFEFNNLQAGTSTSPVLLNESPLYFFSYIITSNTKYYFEPDQNQLTRILKHGELSISILIERQSDGKPRVVMHPEIA